MSRGLGPPLIDFSPLGQLGSTFFDAYDRAKLQAYQDQASKLYDRQLSLGALAPAGASLGAPAADVGGVPDVLGTPRPRPPSFGLSGPIGQAAAQPAAPAPAAARSLPTFAQGGAIGQYAAAIQGNESGGKYNIVGPRHPKLGRALGAYQVMEANVGPWSREALGREVSAEEFLGSKQIQDAVFQHKFGQYVQKYGTPERAAAAWFSGSPNTKSAARDSLGTSVPKYVQSFAANLRKAGGAPEPDLPATQVALPAAGGETGRSLAQDTQGNVPFPPPRPAQVASADPNFMPAPSPAMARVQQEAAARGIGQQPAEAVPSRPAQFLAAQAQNRAGIPTAGPEGDPATASDFIPGSTAVPAQPPQYGQPAPGAQALGPTPTALSLLSKEQKDNLRAMLANPVTRQHAMQMIDKLNAPEEFEVKEAGGQFYRIGKRTGTAQVIPGISKPQEWTPFNAPDGNSYLVNKHSGQTKRMIEGGKFQDVTDPNELARVRPPGYQGPVQRDKEGQYVYPGSTIHAADQRVDVTDPAELARVRPAGYSGPVQRGKSGELYFPGSGAAGINLQSAGDAAAQKARIEQFEKMANKADDARKAAVDIENLRELGRNIGPAGAAAGLKEALGPIAQPLGIEIKGLSDIQAYQSIIKRLTPQMREPGSGNSSNLDVQMFEKALPGLLMHPDGREMVLDVMKAGNQYEAEKAAIAQAALNTEALGGISHAEAARRMRELEEPIQRFKAFRAANPTVVRDALQAKPAAGGAAAGEDTKNLPRIPANATPQQVRERFKSGTRVILPDGTPGVVP